MLVCRLFRADNPFEQVEARPLAMGHITLGRDASADWPLEDTDGTLSRIHCMLLREGGRLFLYDRSTNGTFLGDGQQAPKHQPVELGVRQTIRLGSFTLLIDEIEESELETSPLQTRISEADSGEEQAEGVPLEEGTLLQAFCEGAKLDQSALSSEDPVELMKRVGAIYQQAVAGLAALMAERAQLKTAFELERTTIEAADNNPFKWTSSRKLAQDLLSGRATGFLEADEAVRACFADLSAHMAALKLGANTAIAQTLQALAPDAIEADAAEQPSLLRGRTSVCWDLFRRRYAALASEEALAGEPPRQVLAESYACALQALTR